MKLSAIFLTRNSAPVSPTEFPLPRCNLSLVQRRPMGKTHDEDSPPWRGRHFRRRSVVRVCLQTLRRCLLRFREMATNCVICDRCTKSTEGISFYAFPKDKDRRKEWLDAIGKTDADLPANASLCSRHFQQSCFVDAVLKNDAVPFLDLKRLDCQACVSIAETAEDGSVQQQQQAGTRSSNPRHMLPVARPTIRRRRIHMLSDEEMKEMQPQKYVRYLKSVNWDEISKLPAEAKIVWEVAMEELKEGNDKIKDLQTHVRQLKATVRKLKAVLKTRTKKRAAAADRIDNAMK